MKNSLISKVFMWMAVGLAVTFATGFIVASNENMLDNIFGGNLYWIFILLELGLVIFLSARVMKLKPVTAKISFLLYSFVSGLTFASIFVVYNLSSIMYIFLVTAIIFGLMSLIGYTTKADLTKLGTYCFIGLVAAIITMLINIFINSDMITVIVSVVCVIVFIGITAYDIQKIKRLESAGLPEENLAIYGALDLYLDFINIFLHLLQLFGDND